jgi:hypothetical protein
MKLTTTLGAAAAAFAAYVYLKRHRSEAGAGTTGFPAAGRDDATPRDHAGLATTPATGTTGMPGTGAESPNIAERMKAAGVQGTPAAGEGLAGSRSSDELFGSSSQQGSGPTSTGLPDLTRGG